MISKETIHLYKTIQAPDNLKERILQTPATPHKRPQNRRWISIAATAACLAIVFLFTLSTPSSTVEIFYNETAITQTPVAVYVPSPVQSRMMPAPVSQPPLQITFVLDGSKKSRLEVTHGELTHNSEENTYNWTISNQDYEETLELKIHNKKTIVTYVLYEEPDGTWYLAKAQ